MRKNPLKYILRNLQISAVLVAAMVAVSIFHSLITHGYIRLNNMANAGIIAGSLMIGLGLLKLLPAALTGFGRLLVKEDKLLDRSTFVERAKPERDHKQNQGLDFIIIGITTTLIGGLFQLIIHILT